MKKGRVERINDERNWGEREGGGGEWQALVKVTTSYCRCYLGDIKWVVLAIFGLFIGHDLNVYGPRWLEWNVRMET